MEDLRRRIGATSAGVGGRGVAARGVLTTPELTEGRQRRAWSAGQAREVLPVVGPLAAALPGGGLPRGSVISVLGPHGDDVRAGQAAAADSNRAGRAIGPGGASSLLLSLLPGPNPRWSALVGLPDIGLLAAAEFGADLNRLVVVPDPGPDVLQVLSVLADGVDLVAVGAPGQWWGPPARLRVLTGRLRQHGTVLLVAGRWPGADLVLTARHTGWAGIGQGSGRLRDRQLVVEVGGRRAGGRHREHGILLAGRRDGVVVAGLEADADIAVAAGADVAVAAGADIAVAAGGAAMVGAPASAAVPAVGSRSAFVAASSLIMEPDPMSAAI